MSTSPSAHDGTVVHPDSNTAHPGSKRKTSPDSDGDQPLAKRLRSSHVATKYVTTSPSDAAAYVATPAEKTSTDTTETDNSSIDTSSTASSRSSTATRPSSVASSPTRRTHATVASTPIRLQLRMELDLNYDMSDLSEPEFSDLSPESMRACAPPATIPDSARDPATVVPLPSQQKVGTSPSAGPAPIVEFEQRRSGRTIRRPSRFLAGQQNRIGTLTTVTATAGFVEPPRPNHKSTDPAQIEARDHSIRGECSNPEAEGDGRGIEDLREGEETSVISVKTRASRITSKKAPYKEPVFPEASSATAFGIDETAGETEQDDMKIDGTSADNEPAPSIKKTSAKRSSAKKKTVKRAPAKRGDTKSRLMKNAALPLAFQTKKIVRGRKSESPAIVTKPTDTRDADYQPNADAEADAGTETDAEDIAGDFTADVDGQTSKDPIARSPRNLASRECLVTVDAKLVKISEEMVERFGDDRPLPLGEPLVWADSRQALCETLPCFKKPQGGSHTNDRHVYGLLVDGTRTDREYMDADVIIRRAAGSMGKDSDGQMRQGKDHSAQSPDNRAILNDIAHQNPVVFIIGSDDTGHPCQMPKRYCVLGWYKPVMLWAEQVVGQGNKTRVNYKQRYERLNDPNHPAWHAPQGSLISCDEQVTELKTHECGSCKQSWPQIYLEGWFCLEASCERFWKVGADNAPLTGLNFNPAFLLHRTPWVDETAPYDLVRPVPDVGKLMGDNLLYVNTRGVICPRCGRCNSRYLWKGWRCDNSFCEWEGEYPKHHGISHQMLQSHSPWGVQGDGASLARNKFEDGVTVQISHLFGYKVARYTIEGVTGCFVHAMANEKLNREAGGPNDMFADLQEKDFGLERRRFAVEKFGKPKSAAKKNFFAVQDEDADDEPLEKGDFMSAFSTNYGMPYKFVASGASQPFENGPDAIRACRSRLNWAANTFLNNDIFRSGTVAKYDNNSVTSDASQASLPPTFKPDRTDFNELLIFGYMEKQKIDYHDDGEEGLGPRIASLSLGGKAQISLRVKAKHFSGISNSTILNADKPIPLCKGGEEMYNQRLAAWTQLQTMDNRAANEYRKAIPKKLGLNGKPKASSDLITVTLGHGDIMLMDGYEIQKYLEHRVVPEGVLRFALTCRDVLPRHLASHELPPYPVLPDTYGYNGPVVEAVKQKAAVPAICPSDGFSLEWHVENPGLEK